MEFLWVSGSHQFFQLELFCLRVIMSREAILAIGLIVFGINFVGVYIYLRIKFEQWGKEDS